MSDETIFTSGEQTPVQATGEQPKPTIVLPDSVKDLVGEGKKYASVEKALEALVHAQNHISNIEVENRELREKMEKAKSAEEVYAAVQEAAKKEKETPAPVKVDEGVIAELLDRKLAEQRAKEAAEANVATVKKALQDKYGEKAEEVYRTRAAELGIGVEFMNGLAAKSSSAVLEYFGLKPSAASVPSRTAGSLNTEALASIHRPSTPPKSVMAGATTKDVTNAWQEAKKRVLEGNQ